MKPTIFLQIFCTVFFAACSEPLQNNNTPTSNVTPYPATNPPPDGKALYMSYCASCHNPLKDATGPATMDALTRWGGDTSKLYAFIRNPQKSIHDGGKNSYQAKLFEKWGRIPMSAYPNLTNEQISAILGYGTEQRY